jgi:hypothetical protein
MCYLLQPEHIPELINIILGLIVAVATTVYVIYTKRILKSNKEANDLVRQQMKRSETDQLNIYVGTLLGIQVELIYHKEFLTEPLKKEINKTHDSYKNNWKILLKRATYFYTTDTLIFLRNKIFDYKDSSIFIIQKIINYTNMCSELNFYLDYENITHVLNTVPQNSTQYVDYFFSDVLKKIEILKDTREEILVDIVKEIDNFLTEEQKQEKAKNTLTTSLSQPNIIR